MNKISNVYESEINIEKTHQLISKIKREITDKLIDNFNLIEIQSPLYSKVKPSTELKTLSIGRPITFDSSEDTNVYYMINDFTLWLMNSLVKLNLKTNSGVLSQIKYINRDIEISNIKSFENNFIEIEYVYENEKNINQKSNELLISIYNIIWEIVTNTFAKDEKIKSAKIPRKLSIEEIDPYEKVLEAENVIDIVKQKGMALIKQNIGNNQILNTGHKEYIIFYEKKSFNPDILIESTIRKGSANLNEKLNVVEEEEFDLIKEVIDGEWKSSINIKINIDHVMMIALKKSHILEVQSGIHSEKIRKFLSEQGIEHL